jgi:low affinity Fe/Cu permease
VEQRYDALTEWLAKYTSRWYSLPLCGLVVFGSWLLLGVDAANFLISVLTLGFFFLLQYGQRKDSLANQLKHDEEIRSSDARDEIQGIEKLNLTELEDKVCDDR